MKMDRQGIQGYVDLDQGYVDLGLFAKTFENNSSMIDLSSIDSGFSWYPSR